MKPHGSQRNSLPGVFPVPAGPLRLLVQSAHAVPEWIWLDDQPKNNQTIYVRTSFDLDQKPSSATLYATADNYLTAYVNGKTVLKNDSWRKPENADVTSQLRSGTNVIAIEGKNDGIAAGILAKLTVDEGDEERTLMETNAIGMT